MKSKTLTKKEIKEILNKYDLGKPISEKHIYWAFGNMVYILRTTRGKFILKIFNAKKEFVEYQVKIADYAESKGLPVPKINKTKLNKRISIYNGKFLIIQDFVEGKPARNMNYNLVRNLAKNIALLNKELLKLKIDGKHTWGEDYQFRKNYWKLDKIKDFDLVTPEKNLIYEIRNLNKDRLRRSVIHGDFHSINLLVQKDKLKAIIDWDDVHEDFMIQEMTTFIAHGFISPKGVNIKQLKIFLKEYKKYLRLNKEEEKAIYYFIKNRLLGSIGWLAEQRRKHPEHKKELTRDIERELQQLKKWNEITLKEFLELLK